MDLQTLRKKIRAERIALTENIRQEISFKITNIVRKLEIFNNSKTIAIYIPFNGEVDSTSLINHIWQECKQCYIPLIKKDAMFFIQYKKEDPLIKNYCGILEPIFDPDKLISPEKLDLVITPLVGFDSQGNRLGTGGGYYDRTFAFLKNPLRHRPYLLGIAYEFQKLEQLIPQEWDIALDMVVTEKEVYYFC
jgi:5-formyltetrahydrofolate cyclo-ligase